jgi:hypothetical protein
MASCSVDPHHAALKAARNTIVAAMWYNVGIQNKEVTGNKYWKVNGKHRKLINDIKNIFTHEECIEILFLSEFGQMGDCIDVDLLKAHSEALYQGMAKYGRTLPDIRYPNTKELFEAILMELNLPHIYVEANPPYVALIDSRAWHTIECSTKKNLCDDRKACVQHIVLQHNVSNACIRCFNAHIPTSVATAQQVPKKTKIIKSMCAAAATPRPKASWGVTRSGVPQPTAPMPWIIGGDCNVDKGNMQYFCQDYIKGEDHCMCLSGWPEMESHNAQKADHAICQGIDIEVVKSWIGKHMPPCASDAHDAVVVKGVLQGTSSETWLSGDLGKPVTDPVLLPVAAMACSGDPPAMACSGDPHPAAQTQNNCGNGDDRKDTEIAIQQQLLNEGGIGCEMSMGEHVVQAVAEHAGHHVQVGCSDDPHHAASTAPQSTSTQYLAHRKAPRGRSWNSDSSDDPHPAASTATQTISMQHAYETTAESLVRTDADSNEMPPTLERSLNTDAGIQSTAMEDHVQAEIQQFVEKISATALEENDFPAASQLAAQHLMQMLFSTKDGQYSKTREQVVKAMAEPIRRRQDCINKHANHHGLDNSNSYSVIEWKYWLTEQPLQTNMMNDAIRQWKYEFPMKDSKRIQIHELFKENTRLSKKNARSEWKGAWKAHLHQEHISSHLATAFLCFPASTVDSLLLAWKSHMHSPEHKREQERSRKIDTEDFNRVCKKSYEVYAKIRVQNLRHQLKLLKRPNADLNKADKIKKELQTWTQRHGYGKLPDTAQVLKPQRFTDAVWRSYCASDSPD